MGKNFLDFFCGTDIMVSIPYIQMEGDLRMIQVILWDIDGTLLDFGLAEKAAIRACFIRFGLGECPDDMLARYSSINQKYWNALELSLIHI